MQSLCRLAFAAGAAGALVASEHLRHVLLEQLPENDRVLQAFHARKPIEWD